MATGGSASKKQRKVGRNLKSGQNLAYKNEHRHEKSHVKRIKAGMRRYGWAKDAEEALIRYAAKLGLAATQSAIEFLKQAKRA